jgi:hypothetical protein
MDWRVAYRQELAELRKPARLTLEVLEKAKLLVRGSLEDGHQPDLWESLRELEAVRNSLTES